MRTNVAIVGGGPAGMLLSHLLWRSEIDNIVIEQRSREYVEARIRAGVIEQGTGDLLRSLGLGARMDSEGFVHEGVTISNSRSPFRVDFKALTGRVVMVYGQTEIQKDLYDSGVGAHWPIVFEAEGVQLHDLATELPSVSFTVHGEESLVEADFIAGCDGFHGVSRHSIPDTVRREYERLYPFGWMGVLSETPPVSHELIYARHPRGFALCSMRNPMLSRYYVQCTADTDAASWSDDRFWDELRMRIPAEAADSLVTGPSIEKSVTPLRSYVAEPMQWGKLFLAGDAAHIVPPTGAKGLNLAFSDVYYLAEALTEHHSSGSTTALDGYGARALQRVWKAVRFSWWMTSMLHTFPDAGEFEHRLQETELDYLAGSPAAQTAMAESYTGLPF
ncbi:MAG TPA: 4-hydroxybenzoate 3-monooxygenase [Ilumatobacteraceae bacterium]|nr:4-hydroxybenzoate 3-monooxygenase [Ilumatobacteraceae bacterium]